MKKELKEPDFPNLTKIAELNHELHVERAVEAGLTVDQAIEHAKEDHKHWSPKHVEKDPHDD